MLSATPPPPPPALALFGRFLGGFRLSGGGGGGFVGFVLGGDEVFVIGLQTGRSRQRRQSGRDRVGHELTLGAGAGAVDAEAGPGLRVVGRDDHAHAVALLDFL